MSDGRAHPPALHDLGRRRARRDAPADAADLRGAAASCARSARPGTRASTPRPTSSGCGSIHRLTTELGLNLAGVETCCASRTSCSASQARIERLERQMREDVALVHKQYRRELVLYRPTTTDLDTGETMDFTKLTIEIAGGGRRRAGAGAPRRQPRDLPRAPACSRCSTRSCRARSSSARASPRTSCAPQAEAALAAKPSRRRARRSSRRVSTAFSRVLDRAEEEMRRLEDEFVSTEHLLLALDVVPRDAARGGAASEVRGAPARHVAGSRGHATRRSRSSAAT